MGDPRIGLGSLVRRWWLVLLAATAGGALVAYVLGSRATPQFEAEADVLIQNPAGLAPTYAEMVKSTPVLAYAIQSVDPGFSVSKLRENVRGESDQDTRIVTIQVEASKGSEAVAFANAIAAGLRRYASSQPRSAAGEAQTPGPRVQLVDAATTAVKVRPRPTLLAEFGALAAFLGALALVLVAEGRKPRVSDEDDLGEASGLPVLGRVNGDVRAAAFPPAPMTWRGDSASYRHLLTRIALGTDSGVPSSLAIVGVGGAEGSCSVALNLAALIAEDGSSVVLVDFEGRELKRSLQLEGQRSGTPALKPAEPVAGAGIVFNRFVLRGSPLSLALPRTPPRSLTVANAHEILNVLSANAEFLIVHAPPLSRTRGALTWGRATQSLLLVVTAERTKHADVQRAVAALEPVRSSLVGVVLQVGVLGAANRFGDELKRIGAARPSASEASAGDARNEVSARGKDPIR